MQEFTRMIRNLYLEDYFPKTPLSSGYVQYHPVLVRDATEIRRSLDHWLNYRRNHFQKTIIASPVDHYESSV